MLVKDKAPKSKEVKGHFKLEMLDKDGNVVDSYEDNNLVVNDARAAMCALIGGKKGAVSINSLVLGTRGHNTKDDNILMPKPVGQDGYDENRQQLFSEEDGNAFYYTILWNPNALESPNGQIINFDTDKVDFVAKGNKKSQTGLEGDAENAKIPVTIDLLGTTVQYTFLIPEIYANGSDGKSTVAYTEAGLKCQDKLFSIKCFAAKVKETSVAMRIIWRIIF